MHGHIHVHVQTYRDSHNTTDCEGPRLFGATLDSNLSSQSCSVYTFWHLADVVLNRAEQHTSSWIKSQIDKCGQCNSLVLSAENKQRDEGVEQWHEVEDKRRWHERNWKLAWSLKPNLVVPLIAKAISKKEEYCNSSFSRWLSKLVEQGIAIYLCLFCLDGQYLLW